MPSLLRQPPVRTALIAAWIGLAGAHAPVFAAPFTNPDLDIVVETCPLLGRDPPLAMFRQSCGVWDPGGLTTSSWKRLELMALDANLLGGGVVATLYCMNRSTGAISAVATVKSAPSTTAKRVTVPLPAPLDLKQCSPFVHVASDSSKAPAQALMVSLRN